MGQTIEPIKFNQDTLRQILEMNRFITEMNAEIVKMLAMPACLLESSPLMSQVKIVKIQQELEKIGALTKDKPC